MTEDIYIVQGYKSRMDYLTCLAEDYGCPIDIVITLADFYGDDEAFDGLVTAVEDYYEQPRYYVKGNLQLEGDG